MRQKTESKERDSTCKALFKCPQCLKEYNEYHAGKLKGYSLIFYSQISPLKCLKTKTAKQDKSLGPLMNFSN